MWYEVSFTVAPFLEPPLDDHFAFREKADGLLALRVQYPEERVLHATEREKCHRRYDADVDADVAADHPVLKLPGAFTGRREYGIAVAIPAGVAYIDSPIEGFRPHDAHHRPENFLAGQFHLRFYPLGNGRPQEAGLGVIAGDFKAFPTVDDEFGAFLDAAFNISDDTFFFIFTA